ncbi:hypothetical protein V6Z12_D10G095700 [Gossypium hirsutum]
MCCGYSIAREQHRVATFRPTARVSRPVFIARESVLIHSSCEHTCIGVDGLQLYELANFVCELSRVSNYILNGSIGMTCKKCESEACSSWKLVGVISHYPSAKSADFGVSKFGYNGMYKSFFL